MSSESSSSSRRGYKRRRRTKYAWGDAKPNVYVVIGFIALGCAMIYCLFFPPDFSWRIPPKTPIIPPSLTNAPAATPTPANPAPPAPAPTTDAAPATTQTPSAPPPTNAPQPAAPAPAADSTATPPDQTNQSLLMPSPYPAPLTNQITK